jgi:enoyl-CoA hydratase/carnithine racemase
MAQVEVERDGAVMTVTLNRPHRKNAMTLTMFALLADAWEEVTANDDIRCVILTGAEGDFSSGMDPVRSPVTWPNPTPSTPTRA